MQLRGTGTAASPTRGDVGRASRAPLFCLRTSDFFGFVFNGMPRRPHGTHISQFKNCWKLLGRGLQGLVDLFSSASAPSTG